MNAVRVGFIQDFSTDNEREREMSVMELRDWLARPIEVVYTTEDQTRLAEDDPDLDLLIVDYGGLHNAYGNYYARYGKAVHRWAEAHPGRLVLIWTAFTTACYKATFEDEFPLDNVFFRYAGAWAYDESAGFQDKIRAWLG